MWLRSRNLRTLLGLVVAITLCICAEWAAQTRFERFLQEMEAAAAGIVEVGDILSREPADPAVHRRYRLYKCVRAALPRPPRARAHCGAHGKDRPS